jgi:uncharacterized protein with von Willebrand factor type A (vWA) domain
MDDALKRMMRSDFARLMPRQALRLWKARGARNGTGAGTKAEARFEATTTVAEGDETL